jgi:hypothetical protein
MTKQAGMKPLQQAAVALLIAAGFAIDQISGGTVRVKRGNDYRLVQMDGQQKRALGAKR